LLNLFLKSHNVARAEHEIAIISFFEDTRRLDVDAREADGMRRDRQRLVPCALSLLFLKDTMRFSESSARQKNMELSKARLEKQLLGASREHLIVPGLCSSIAIRVE
jgi:hypothetical protein